MTRLSCHEGGESKQLAEEDQVASRARQRDHRKTPMGISYDACLEIEPQNHTRVTNAMNNEHYSDHRSPLTICCTCDQVSRA